MPAVTSPWWDKNRHADRRPGLLARGRIRGALRGWFEGQGFTEVECGALAASPGNEAHLHGFETTLLTIDGEATPAYLHTSPEFAAKKLLAAGETKIFDFARVFRNRERGPLHQPEFTMLEWYRAEDDYQAVIGDTLHVVIQAADVTGVKEFVWRERVCDPRAPAERLSVAEAFQKFAQIDLLSTLSAAGAGDRPSLANAARATGFDVVDSDNWADIFSKILVAKIEPNLGLGAPTLLYEYPRCEAALARACAHDARVAERFELYVCGIELANGFGELIDPFEQRKRFEAEMDEKERVYGMRYPIDTELLAALAQMPPSSGVALGFDRLVMLATGARSIADVIWTPAPNPATA